MRFTTRSDLALEALETSARPVSEITRLEGVVARTRKTELAEITDIEITNERGAQTIGKPVGRYITISSPDFTKTDANTREILARYISETIRQVISTAKIDKILIFGLGNPNITPDSVGPEVVKNIVVTRHLARGGDDTSAITPEISAISPGVSGMTGVESAELLHSLLPEVRPDIVVVIDSLATGSVDRLCRSVQITDTGITPGSGVANARAAITAQTTGVPVITLGVPTVADTSVIINDFLDRARLDPDELPEAGAHESFMVTPKDIDIATRRISRILALAINTTFLKEFSYGELERIINM